MKIYRTVHPDFGNAESIFTGTGAATYPGRWNVVNQSAIYCSSNIQTSTSERAYHSVLRHIESYNVQTSTRGSKIPMSFIEDISNVRFSLAEIEFIDDGFLAIRTDGDLQRILLAAGLISKDLPEARKSMYQLLKPAFWTRHVSKFINDQGYKGFSIPSARTHNGETFVIFEDQLKDDEYKINQIVDIRISAICASNGAKIKKGTLAQLDKVMYECPLESGFAEVLKL